MRRRRLPAVVLAAAVIPAAAVAAPPAGAAVRQLEPARAFRRQVERIKSFTALPVLLPDRVAIDVPRSHGIEARWTARRASWTLSLGIGPRCGGANACFVGAFSADRGGRPSLPRRVRLHGGVTGYFKPTSCGASCSPPELQWVRRGVLYDLQFREAGRGTDRAKLVRLANSALAAGPR